jgi:hypothetical protein
MAEIHDSAGEATPASPTRKLRWGLCVLAVGLGLLWGGHQWLVREAKAKLNERLAERGLTLKSKGETWSVLGGITLKEAALYRLKGEGRPLLQISQLDVDVLWGESWADGQAITQWRAKEATVVLTDEEGTVELRDFTTDFVLRDQTLEITQAGMRHEALKTDLRGEIMLGGKGEGPQEVFELDLRVLRGVLNTLRFQEGSGEFLITGVFSADLRNQPVVWRAEVKGTGQVLNWRGLPMQEALVEGEVSQGGLSLAADLKLPGGEAVVELTRSGWREMPLMMGGTLTDSKGRSDVFKGSYDGGTQTVTVAEIQGNADLLELARGFPALADKVPAAVTVKTFPEIVARDFVMKTGVQPPVWTLASVQLKTPAALGVEVRGKQVEVDEITGGLSYQEGEWNFAGLKGRMLGGRFTLDANYDGEALSKAKVTMKSLQLARLEPWLGEVSGGLAKSDLSLVYHGVVCNDPVRSSGSGSLVLTNAPVVHIPLLEQAYALFPKLLPDRGRAGAGSFEVTFSMRRGVATIDPFKGRSEAMTVTAKGTVDLVKGQVEGHARANLRGVVGRITLPLSHVLTDMTIRGPLDDIRVSPEGPVGGVKKLLGGSAEVAKDSVQLSGKVLKEGLRLPFQALGMFGDEGE